MQDFAVIVRQIEAPLEERERLLVPTDAEEHLCKCAAGNDRRGVIILLRERRCERRRAASGVADGAVVEEHVGDVTKVGAPHRRRPAADVHPPEDKPGRRYARACDMCVWGYN